MADEPLLTEDDETLEDAPRAAERLQARIDAPGVRLDKALAEAFPTLSRARLQALLADGAVTRDGQTVSNGSAKAQTGLYVIALPPVAPATPQPEAIPLTVLFEDADLIIIDKAPGMAAHPAPGCQTGTLVNALLAHCGDSLSGIGGVARPGIVHRLDKDTSTRGAPSPEKGRIQTQIGRSNGDRKKMAVLRSGGREAITDYVVQQTFGRPAKASNAPLAARVACTLHTGRTHQIRVHMASKGAPLLGDPVYGSGSPAAPVRAAVEESGLKRQALHAAVLGFVHPVTGQPLRFETAPPDDMQRLEALLSEL